MAVSRSSSLLVVAAALLLPIICPAYAQTTKKPSVGPAEEVVSGDSASNVDLFRFETVQLTDAVLANLTTSSPNNAELFKFDDDNDQDITLSILTKAKRAKSCKVFPSDATWPSNSTWQEFNSLLGNTLITTIPPAASCYSSWPNQTDVTTCSLVSSEWTDSYFHMDDPTSVMWPLYQGRTCMPTADESASCTLGGYPEYAINVSSVAQIQLAVNFARNANLRLVVKNTGHDFNGKSAGAGALSIWTHYLKDITVIDDYSSGNYTGKAVKMGAGVQAHEIYTTAKEGGFTAVGGEGRTVGVAGGYMAGGGHSPLSSVYGMAADQVLAIEVVTPNGKFVTATDVLNSDLFWALRGGGGGTFGVVTSITVKVYPIIPITVMTFSFATSSSISSTTFWEGVRTYYDYFVTFSNAGTYSYFSVVNLGAGGFNFAMSPFFAPNLTVTETEELVKPWLDRLAALGIEIAPVTTHYDNFYDAWYASFPLETVGSVAVKTASRLFPRSNWADETSLNVTFDAIKYSIEQGGAFLSFNMAGALHAGNTANSVNPAWRETVHHAIVAAIFTDTTNTTLMVKQSETLTNDWMAKYRAASPSAGAYMSEADASEPDWQQAFYGSNYDRLYDIKRQYDPKGVFYAHTAVGSELWYITDQVDGLPTQNGRLCPV